jgi:hypothetical protein
MLPVVRAIRYSLLTLTTCAVGVPAFAHANPEILAFVSDGTTTATSSDISTYNAFVTDQAALNAALPSTT